ncbi:unnamed protein product [Adineta steineri]|uniref:YEATS domain-containing protein n=1 Tax=Adineta steineri TaxID=433720 RepID=A0A815Q1J7_9BILA|nr:unnamed protein product [Adineta steineri]CAF1632277.1 unnamed protein product [Adineta steineri]
MNDRNGISETIEIDFEVGHSSIIRCEATTIHNPPRTHDWKLFLRSADVNGDLSCLIQRCVFHLHHEYPNSKRELKTTPYAIQESGYAGFHLPIEIYFKTKTEPKKFRIEYELDLHKPIDGRPYQQKESYLRKYRFTIYNPDPEFRQKILAAGGKIVDSGPITSNNIDSDESEMDDEQMSSHESIGRHSPPQKRPLSPSPTPNVVNKKVKVEQSINNSKKKQVQSIVKNENSSKTTTTPNIKKPKLVSSKSSTVVEGKIIKTSSNQPITVSEIIENSPSTKPRSSTTKLIKSQSTNDIKSSSQPTTMNTKKKEIVPSPSKIKTVISSQNASKKSIIKNPHKISIKTEQTSATIVKSPSTVVIKRESLSQPSTSSISPTNTTITSASINNLKKIPKKKVLPSSVIEKRSRSSMPSPSLKKNSQGQESLTSKTPTNLKRDRSLSSVKKSTNNSQSGKTNIIKDRKNSNLSKPLDQPNRPLPSPSKLLSNQQKCQTLNSSKSIPSPDQPNRHLPSPSKLLSNQQKCQTLNSPKSIPSPAQSNNEPSISSVVSSSLSSIDTFPPLPNINSPSTDIFQTEDNPVQPPMNIDRQNSETYNQFSDKSNSFHEQLSVESNKIPTNPVSCSEQSDPYDSDVSQDDNNNDEEDLPSSLTNDDLRYKLIYIYKRFQLNSINDLIIFVSFFKRHQLFDISTLSMTKTSDEMFTYDLFSLSPSHIGELANDLGYSTINTIEQ